ncbi:Omp18 [Campylobacter sputorum subsp. bubulus]|uniref:Peptidoglycan-associated lipoprotein n=1 Tax=Campylobacter sputorum subsp. sputorum TaxID=32024 RepID=A0A381DJG6_9BACT|nr:OmpA family protein [Campylobacter sputorum]ASM35815.1 Tol-Pal system peptidoglycan-associated lipoprotein [Campylobacter sputorum aubsp. sputorum RM3237]ASM37505.1 Tol-Pal system peptidoglycan-associated lipoprotein [Campylobacter sputorum bv. faecalis CCUG 20703]ASM39173.1 Tol-Pal system peptidoglycan-associated lipoprotein [Campylobacter sputorum bv. paraureolyticus LMG 11764]KAB0581528.1 OmpA family protein [Campylobacter sputorum subsp. sputorum]MDY6120897.1 OmpA family protein [Campyl
MKKIFLVSVAAAAILFSGCSQKSPEVDTSASSQGVSNDYSGSRDTMSEADRLNALIAQLNSQIKTVYFDFDKFNIKSDMQPVVATNADLLSSSDASSLSIKLEGNCDEWGTDEYNYALGLKRAKAVKDALSSRGINADRISIVSNGKSNPVCTERSKSCDSQNRRADFTLLP